jgi:hypothetical protein
LIPISLKYEVSDWLEDLGLICLLLELRSLAITYFSEGLFLTSVGEETSFGATFSALEFISGVMAMRVTGMTGADAIGGKLAGRTSEVAGDDCREFRWIVEVPLSRPVHPKSLGVPEWCSICPQNLLTKDFQANLNSIDFTGPGICPPVVEVENGILNIIEHNVPIKYYCLRKFNESSNSMLSTS